MHNALLLWSETIGVVVGTMVGALGCLLIGGVTLQAFGWHPSGLLFALVSVLPLILGPALGFLACGYLARRLRARCRCGLRALRMSSRPVVYRCAGDHTTALETPDVDIPFILGLESALDREALRGTERVSVVKSETAGSVSLTPGDQGTVSIAVDRGTVSIGDEEENGK